MRNLIRFGVVLMLASCLVVMCGCQMTEERQAEYDAMMVELATIAKDLDAKIVEVDEKVETGELTVSEGKEAIEYATTKAVAAKDEVMTGYEMVKKNAESGTPWWEIVGALLGAAVSGAVVLKGGQKIRASGTGRVFG